jgi:hypothetical protein
VCQRASERARAGRVVGPCVLLGRASAAGLQARVRTTVRDWAACCWAELEEESARAAVLFFFFKNMNSSSICLFQ